MADFCSKQNSRRITGLAKVIFSVFFLFYPMAMAQEKTSPPSNEALLRQTIGEVLQDCLPEAPLDSQMVWVKEEGENPSSWLVKEEIVSFLGKRGPVGLSAGAPAPAPSQALSFRIIKLNLSYPQVKKKGLFAKTWVKREAVTALSFSLSDSGGKVLWSKRGEKSKSDLVKRDELLALNNHQYPLLCPEIPEGSWGRYLEPAVVTVVVGGLVYLFFANR